MTLGSVLLRFITGIVVALIMGPIIVVVIVSFSSGELLTFPLPGFSLRWFYSFFSIPEMRNAFALSLILAFTSATTAVVFGMMGAIYTSRRDSWLSHILQLLFITPLIFPTIVLGLALLLLYRTFGMWITPGLFIAHVIVCLPYSFRAVLASLQSFDVSLEDAGQSLGAGPIRSFMLITLPIIWPGILSGWLFAFVVSFGELNVGLFLTGPGVVTLPIEIFSYLQFQGSQLVVAAASALQILVIIVILFVANQLIGVKRMAER